MKQNSSLTVFCNRQYLIIKLIIIDNIPNENTIYVCGRNHLLNEPDILKKFDCRKKLYQRSKLRFIISKNLYVLLKKKKESMSCFFLPSISSITILIPYTTLQKSRILMEGFEWNERWLYGFIRVTDFNIIMSSINFDD